MLMRSLALAVLALLPVPGRCTPLRFHVTFTKNVANKPFTGRVFVVLTTKTAKTTEKTLRPFEPKWINTEPFFAVDVKQWKTGDVLIFDDNAMAFPKSIAQIERRDYSIMAVMDFDRGGRSAFASQGNAFSKPIRLKLNSQTSGEVSLAIDQIYGGQPFRETDHIKLVDIPSPLLSKFHAKPMRLRAGVVLPKSYSNDPKKRFPVIYNIPGFGGTHHYAHRAHARNATDVDGVEMLYVVLDPACRYGHHTFADSANNGPVGKALVSELIPHIEKCFHALGSPAARFVTGHSSGGWSSLWLQITYPHYFGGVWSTAPDSVDFRDFQKVNIYRLGTNLFTDRHGKPRPLARRNGKATLFYKPFSDMEDVFGHGGQLGSFEAVFGPRSANGKPAQLWDRKTGAVNPAVAQSWQQYDIRMILEHNWKSLGPKLRGKIHVYMGAEDNYYLDGATRLLKSSLAKLGSDAVIEVFPGRDHGNLLTKSLRERIAREMAQQFRRGFSKRKVE